jgi:L-fucose isomerase-like protein
VSDTRFWNSVEKLEGKFVGAEIDETEFRRKMRRKGFDPEIIDERVEALENDKKLTYSRSYDKN